MECVKWRMQLYVCPIRPYLIIIIISINHSNLLRSNRTTFLIKASLSLIMLKNPLKNKCSSISDWENGISKDWTCSLLNPSKMEGPSQILYILLIQGSNNNALNNYWEAFHLWMDSLILCNWWLAMNQMENWSGCELAMFRLSLHIQSHSLRRLSASWPISSLVTTLQVKCLFVTICHTMQNVLGMWWVQLAFGFDVCPNV